MFWWVVDATVVLGLRCLTYEVWWIGGCCAYVCELLEAGLISMVLLGLCY